MAAATRRRPLASLTGSGNPAGHSACLTARTSPACCSGDIFLCTTPMPPARAIAIAVRAPVTESIAALNSGIFSSISVVKRDLSATSPGNTWLCAGTTSTSSKVSAIPPGSGRNLGGNASVDIVGFFDEREDVDERKETERERLRLRL